MAHLSIALRYGDWSADVDEELADAVLELWHAGIETASSCQDEGEALLALCDVSPWLRPQADFYAGRSYIDFPNVDGVLRFYDAVANGGGRDAIYGRMSSPATMDAWEVRATVFDTLPTIGTGDWGQASTYGLGVMRVRFPRADASLIAGRVMRWNSGERGPHGEPAPI